jgi:hypothetical protein
MPGQTSAPKTPPAVTQTQRPIPAIVTAPPRQNSQSTGEQDKNHHHNDNGNHLGTQGQSQQHGSEHHGHQNDAPTDPIDGEVLFVSVDFDQANQDSQQVSAEDIATPQPQLDSTEDILDSQQDSLDNVEAIAEALRTVSQPDLSADPAATEFVSTYVQQQPEAPSHDQIADSLAQLAGSNDLEGVTNIQADSQSQHSSPDSSSLPEVLTPTSAEIAAATEQVIASAPQVEPPVLREEPAKLDDQDPFRENPPVSTSSSEESLSSEEVLAEEPSQPVDQQQDDDLPPLT